MALLLKSSQWTSSNILYAGCRYPHRLLVVSSANIISRLYSSSSSSSSSTKKNNTTPNAPQKQELSFVHVNHIHPRDLAQSTFFAGHRPLLTFGSEQMQQNVQNKQAWEEEDYEEENAGSNVNTTPLTNPLSPYLTSSPFHPAKPTISMSTADSKFISYRFLSEIESKFRREQLAEDLSNKQNILVKKLKVDDLIQEEQSVNSKTKREKTLYLTNIIQKRRLKMKKHKLRKLRKRTRALRRKLGKI